MALRKILLIDRAPVIYEPIRPAPPPQHPREKVALHLGNIEEFLTQQARLTLHSCSKKATRDEGALINKSPAHRMRLTNANASSELSLCCNDYARITREVIYSGYTLISTDDGSIRVA